METKNCETCNKELPVCKIGKRKGQPLRSKQRFCSKDCLDKWQREVMWEDRIGKERATEIRCERSQQSSGDNNPSKNPEVAQKISKSLSLYLKENPRIGEKNPFFGKEHTEEYKKWASESRKGKWAYDYEGYLKQYQNAPRKENHPNWKGGSSNGDYDCGFDSVKKALIKTRDNFVCQICGCDENTQLLRVHHIDYDKQNSDEKNLITLCMSCHSKTNWRRESWIQFFKPIMEEKYI